MSAKNATMRAKIARSQGFTLIEVMISMAILMIALLSLLAVFGLAMASTQTSQQNAIAKQLADEAVEGILTARETSTVPWTSIANVPTGIFLSGAQPIDCAGADGIIGTADDAACGPQILDLPGPTGVIMSSGGVCAAPDVCMPLTQYTRTIAIAPATDVNGNPIATLDTVTITVTYTNPQLRIPQSYVLNTYVSQYR
jgi:prepilin-type N-terminal cleavage/methylation domain-containing protein